MLPCQDSKNGENNETLAQSAEMTKNAAEMKQKGDQNTPTNSKQGGKNEKQGSQGSDPPKEDYIHVRARRGQATNSHSLAERVKNESCDNLLQAFLMLYSKC